MTVYNRDELKAEDWPFCDLCDEPMDDGDGENDWNGETGNHLSCEVRLHDLTCQDHPQEKYSVVATYSDASYRTWIVWGNRRKAGRLAASIRSGNHDGLMLVSVQPVRAAYASTPDRHHDEPDLSIRHDDDAEPCRACGIPATDPYIGAVAHG